MKINPVKQTVYKVLRRHGDDLESCIIQGEWCLKYAPQLLTKPRVGKIFAFESLSDAQNFINKEKRFTLESWEIWEAEAYGVSVGKIRALRPSGNLLYVWREIDKGLSEMLFVFAPAPKGTLFCKSIKLIEKVS